MSKNCPINTRMKKNYESRYKIKLTRRMPVIIRIDGKAFHTYTKGLERPYDSQLREDMEQTAIYLCQNIQGAKCAYVQSDEINILLTDYDKLTTDAWFDYDLMKMCSVSASMATSMFNYLRLTKPVILGQLPLTDSRVRDVEEGEMFFKIAEFDSRAFNLPREEVANYFIARQKDAVKNSISMLAQSLYSHKELDGKSSDQMQELCFQKGHNWNDYSIQEKRGSWIIKSEYWDGHKIVGYMVETYREEIFYSRKNKKAYLKEVNAEPSIRTKWEVQETPLNFSEEDFSKWL